jgi:trimeric autotransporter adhesin
MLLGFAGLGACDGGGGGGSTQLPPGPPPPAATVSLRLINAGWTDPPLNVLIDDKSIATNLDFGQAVGLSLTAGSHQITVYGDMPGVGGPAVYGPAAVNFDANTSYVVAVEDTASGTVAVNVFPQPSGAVPAQSARIQVLEAYDSRYDESLLIYVTAPGADLATSTPLGNLSFPEATDSTEVPAGPYEIRLVESGSAALLYDSGTLTLGAGADYSLVIAASGPLDLPTLLLDSVDAAARNYLIYPSGTMAELTIVNDASGTASTVGPFFANGVNLFPNGIVSEYTSSIGASVTPGANTIVIEPGSSTVTLNANLQEGLSYSLFVLGDTQTSGMVVQDAPRPYAGFALLRFVHGAPSAPAVDVYTSPPGPGVTPLFRSLTYFSATAFVSVEPESPIYVTKAGTTTLLAELAAPEGAGGPGPLVDQTATFVLADGDGLGLGPFCIFVEGGFGVATQLCANGVGF